MEIFCIQKCIKNTFLKNRYGKYMSFFDYRADFSILESIFTLYLWLLLRKSLHKIPSSKNLSWRKIYSFLPMNDLELLSSSNDPTALGNLHNSWSQKIFLSQMAFFVSIVYGTLLWRCTKCRKIWKNQTSICLRQYSIRFMLLTLLNGTWLRCDELFELGW